MKPRWMCLAILALAALPASVALAAELDVGPGKPFARIEDALAKAQPGDTILVFPQAQDAPYEKVAVLVTKPRITFKAAPTMPIVLAAGEGGGEHRQLSGKGFDYTGVGSVPRAIFQFNPGADGCVLEGFDLFGAHNESHNGSGVRINQANNVAIRNCRIHANDMGIMSNGDGTPKTAANQFIDSCLIHSNGDPTEPGQNHNLYLGGTSVRLMGCEVHSSLTGHNVKSRAHFIEVEACYVHDSANREFDLVDAKGDTTTPGSNALLLNNIIVKNPKCEGNKNVIHFGQDGGNEHDGTLTLINNTIVTPFLSPVVALDAPKAKVEFTNNIIWDGGANQHGQVLVNPGKEAVSATNSWVSANFAADAAALGWAKTFVAKPGQTPPFVNPAKGDYHLAKADPSIVGAGEPWNMGTVMFKPPLGYEPRSNRTTLGAYEFSPAGK
jgi:hypothetical protein